MNVLINLKILISIDKSPLARGPSIMVIIPPIKRRTGRIHPSSRFNVLNPKTAYRFEEFIPRDEDVLMALRCLYRGADKYLARPTSRYILFDG